MSFKRGLTIDKLPSLSRFLSLAQLSYGVQTRFLGKSMGKLYWKEGERNKHDTVQSNWCGTVLLGSSAISIMTALDGEATVAELSDGAIYYNSRCHWDQNPQPTRRRSATSDEEPTRGRRHLLGSEHSGVHQPERGL